MLRRWSQLVPNVSTDIRAEDIKQHNRTELGTEGENLYLHLQPNQWSVVPIPGSQRGRHSRPTGNHPFRSSILALFKVLEVFDKLISGKLVVQSFSAPFCRRA